MVGSDLGMLGSSQAQGVKEGGQSNDPVSSSVFILKFTRPKLGHLCKEFEKHPTMHYIGARRFAAAWLEGLQEGGVK